MPKISVPEEFLCPITTLLIEDPVIIDEDETGTVYERKAIEQHFSRSDKNPITNLPAASKKLVTDYRTRRKIADFIKESDLCSKEEFIQLVKTTDIQCLKSRQYLESYLGLKEDKKSLLHLAVDNKNLEILKFLLDEGAVLHTTDETNGQNIFHYAAKQGWLEGVKFLSERVKDIESLNNNKCSALCASIIHRHTDVAKFLIEKGAKLDAVDDDAVAPILSATWKNNAEIVNILVNRNVNLNVKDEDHRSALHLAARYGEGKESQEIVLSLLNGGVDINSKDKRGNTPLHEAVKKKRKEIIKTLIDFGADTDSRNKEGLTPLESASGDVQSYLKQCKRRLELKKVKMVQEFEEVQKENEILKYKLHSLSDAFYKFQLQTEEAIDKLESENTTLKTEIDKLNQLIKKD